MQSSSTAWWQSALKAENRWFLLGVLALLILRCFHLGEAIDGPHAWRQSDTANYIWDFYQNGIDLLHPSVCWMGGHQTMILEFPLHEAIAALFYKAFGPSHLWARLVTLFFFMVSVFYLYKVVKLLSSKQVAQIAVLIYMVLPLSLFYSRAVHVDFVAVGLAHAMLWYYLQGIQQNMWKHILVGTLFAIPAFMVKAPYCFYLALPLVWWIWKQKRWREVLKFSPLFILPVIAFGLWIWHTKTINAQAPDWFFIPGYHKFTAMTEWYFGSWHQRTLLESWQTLGWRMVLDVAGWVGLACCLGGIFLGRKAKGYGFFAWWGLGTLIYVLLFFNLNKVHNYYQIPLLAPVAIFAALAINQLYQRLKGKLAGKVLLVLFPLLIGGENIYYSEITYYETFEDQVTIGETIAGNTPEDALVIVSWGGLGCHFPNVLYNARRNGWSIVQDFLSPEIAYKLYKEGASYLAVVRYSEHEGKMRRFTDAFPDSKVVPVNDAGLNIYLYHLEDKYLTP